MERRCWCLAAVLLLICAHAESQELRLQSVERKISLMTPVAKVTDNLKVKNTGSAPANVLVLCYLESIAQGLSSLKVSVKATKLAVAPLAAPPAGAPPGVTCYSATLAPPLAPEATESVAVLASFFDTLKPNPAKAAQGEPHLLEYTDNVYLVSPYTVSVQNTEVVLPTRTIKSYRGEKGSQSDNRVSFGRFEVIQPWTLSPLYVHFEHSKPFKKVVKLVREIQVSHWGNIYVDEQYLLKNAGAELAGPFSRLKYAQMGIKGHSFRDVRAKLPAGAHSIYFRDIIGNISSSVVRPGQANTIVDLDMRYPLMGGWQVDFNLGYSLPLEGFLYRRPGGKVRLLVDFGAPMDDVYVEDLEVRVVLPEGASAIEASVPFEVGTSFDKKYTYLDTGGRPVLVLTKRNAGAEHRGQFAVDYSFSGPALLREPLMLVGAFAAFFATVALYARTEFTISRDSKWQARQAAERISGLVSELEALLAEATDAATRAASSAVASLTSASASEGALAAKAQAETALKDIDAQVKAVLRRIEDLDGKAAERLREHADKGRALHQRALKVVSDKAEAVRKGGSGSDAASKAASALEAVKQALADWEDTPLA